MLNLIQGKLVIANPANITPNSQRSTSEKVTLQHYVIARRREPTKQSKKVIRFGLLRCSKATPRNDASLLWIDSLSRKSGSMVGNDYSMVLLSSSLKQPIYVFENGKMLQSYGKSQGGKPISIGYNPANQQYFSLTNKGSNNSGSIYDAISGSTQGKYSSDFLQSIACPITASSGAAPNPPPPLPKPPGGISGGLAAGGQPLYSFNAAGSGEIALPLELLGKPPPQIIVPPDIPASSKSAAESTEFKWTEEGVAKLLAASQTKDNQPFDYSMLFLNKDEQLKRQQTLTTSSIQPSKVLISQDTFNYLNNVLPINPPQQHTPNIKPKPPGGAAGGSAAGGAAGGSSGGQPLYSFNAAGSGEIALPLELLKKVTTSDIPPQKHDETEAKRLLDDKLRMWSAP